MKPKIDEKAEGTCNHTTAGQMMDCPRCFQETSDETYEYPREAIDKQNAAYEQALNRIAELEVEVNRLKKRLLAFDHNHITRDIKEPGICPACDRHHQKTIIAKLKACAEFYGDEMNYSVDDYHGISGEMRKRCVLYSDCEERNDVYSYAGKKARTTLAEVAELEQKETK